MSNTPSDAELKKLAEECGIGWGAGLGGMDDFLRTFSSAVLSKWGTPQPVVREPLTPSEYNIALGCATDIPPSRYEVVTRAIERAHGITQKGGQHER